LLCGLKIPSRLLKELKELNKIRHEKEKRKAEGNVKRPLLYLKKTYFYRVVRVPRTRENSKMMS